VELAEDQLPKTRAELNSTTQEKFETELDTLDLLPAEVEAVHKRLEYERGEALNQDLTVKLKHGRKNKKPHSAANVVQGGKRARTRVLADDDGGDDGDGDDDEEEEEEAEDGDDADHRERTPDKTALSRRQQAGKQFKDSMAKGKRGGREEGLDKFMLSFTCGRDRAALEKEENEIFELLKNPQACSLDSSPEALTATRIHEGILTAKCLRDLGRGVIERISSLLRGTLPVTFTRGVHQVQMMAEELQRV
jgi:hypothetical protein